MKTIVAFIRKHPLLTYFALTFALSWGGVLLIIGGPGALPASLEQLEILGPILYIGMLVGPTAASILLTGLVYGRPGFRELRSRLLRRRVGARWYAIALLIAPLSIVAVLYIFSLSAPIVTTDGKASLLLSAIVAGFMVGIFEELGWTGFVIPRLRLQYGIPTTGLIVGLLWGAWHFLLFWESDSFSGALGMALLLVRLFSWLPAYRVLMVWVYDRTQSLLVAMLMHASLVASMSLLQPSLTGMPALTFILVWAAALWLVVAAVTVANRRQLSRQPPEIQAA